MEIDLPQLRDLMAALAEFDLSEIEIEQGEERVVLRRGTQPAQQIIASAAPVGAPLAAASAPAAPNAEPVDDPSLTYITSPFVGTFYRSPAPDAGPFAELGQRIEKGQTLCIVEAMKLMNEIESEIGGTLAECLVENGKPVEFGDRLFAVRKD